ncbi:MAG: hypothetical protein JO073_08840 [Actinobacteria bacterium]|nr:hypothetical protein [Actinomycetota bacterium]
MVQTHATEETTMKKYFEFGGIAAGIILVAFGVAAIVLGYQGKNTVVSSLKEQQIVGTPDMTPKGIAAEAKAAGLPSSIRLPTCSVANLPVDNGTRARCFADYMRIHAYEATGGVPYAKMPRYATANGKGTNDPTKALTQNGQPVDNAARNTWVTETALSTALNVSYMADQIGNFGIVVGIALLLSGVGFIVLAVGGALRAGGWLFARAEKAAAAKNAAASGV